MNGRSFCWLIACAFLMACLAAGCSVPDVVGDEYNDARHEIVNAFLDYEFIPEYSSVVAKDHVISQDPQKNQIVLPFSTVYMMVSVGSLPGTGSTSTSVSVPDVAGLAESAANAAITQAGLTVGTITRAFSDTVATGVVISQDPAAGTSVNSGSAIALTVSKGPTPTSAAVPDVAGQAQAAALASITETGLPTPAILQQCSATVPSGTVISQNPSAGTVVGITSVVAILVSSGTCTGGVEVDMLPVAAGTFTMGNSGAGDDVTYGQADESPTHQVTLSAYQIGKYEVTNGQFCAVLNWAYAQGYLKDAFDDSWSGTGDPYVSGDSARAILYLMYSNIQFSGGTFSSATTLGSPAQTVYSTEHSPVVGVTWYGAAAFCNWLSQMHGLTPCYDMTTVDWPLVVAPPTSGGYRLPTEAEWERAAAWDGTKHWIYGFGSDTLTALSQANYGSGNPFGLIAEPYTSPVGWFNGVNVNPNGDLTTNNSISPIGARDMSGNAAEWCQDFFLDTYYSGGDMTNPTGPQSAQQFRAARGGSSTSFNAACRSASRAGRAPAESAKGFRLTRS